MKKFLVFCLSSVLFLTVGIVSSVAQNNGAATIVESRQQILKYNIHVQDNNDEPIIGATVRIEGTSKGTITDKNGNATVNEPPGTVIEISFVSYQTQKVQLRNNHNITVTMQEDIVLIPQL